MLLRPIITNQGHQMSCNHSQDATTCLDCSLALSFASLCQIQHVLGSANKIPCRMFVGALRVSHVSILLASLFMLAFVLAFLLAFMLPAVLKTCILCKCDFHHFSCHASTSASIFIRHPQSQNSVSWTGIAHGCHVHSTQCAMACEVTSVCQSLAKPVWASNARRSFHQSHQCQSIVQANLRC